MTVVATKIGYERTFNRFELKYLIHYKTAREFARLLGPHVRHDENAGDNGFYKIASLYYDSPDLKCYWEKLDGEKYRRKVRIRTYGHAPEEAFVEVKQRYNLSVQKRRCKEPVDRAFEVMEQICRGHLPPDLDPHWEEIFILSQRYRLEPKMIISYQRAALFDRFKRDLRITFDRNIRCRHLGLDLRRNRTNGRFAVPPTMVLMEVKFNEAIPRWLCTCLNSLDLEIQRLSKYCAGVEASGILLRQE